MAIAQDQSFSQLMISLIPVTGIESIGFGAPSGGRGVTGIPLDLSPADETPDAIPVVGVLHRVRNAGQHVCSRNDNSAS